MTNPISFYAIFYGTQWSAGLNNLSSDLAFFVNNLGSSAWYSYVAALTVNGVHLASSITYAGEFRQTNLQFGTQLGQNGAMNIVQAAIANGNVGSSNLVNSIYMVIPGDDVSEPSLCNSGGDACGYHSWYLDKNKNLIKYGAVNQALSGGCTNNLCSIASNGPQSSGQSNDLIRIMAHEIAETVTDPQVVQNPGWTDSGNTAAGEIGDLCNSINTGLFTLPNGKQYNTQIGNRLYIMQGSYDASTGCCAIPPPNVNTTFVPASSGAIPSSPPFSPAASSVLQFSKSVQASPANKASGILECRQRCTTSFLICKKQNPGSRLCRLGKNACVQACGVAFPASSRR